MLRFLQILLVCIFLAVHTQAHTPTKAYKLLVFLDTECPLCQQYSSVINTLQKKWEKSIPLQIIGIFPSRFVNSTDIEAFKQQYQVNYVCVQDKHLTIVKQWKAKVTPEVILLDAKNTIVYRGLIDNWYYELGKKRREPTTHYLDEALRAISQKQKPLVTQTSPIGCFIQQ